MSVKRTKAVDTPAANHVPCMCIFDLKFVGKLSLEMTVCVLAVLVVSLAHSIGERYAINSNRTPNFQGEIDFALFLTDSNRRLPRL